MLLHIVHEYRLYWWLLTFFRSIFTFTQIYISTISSTLYGNICVCYLLLFSFSSSVDQTEQKQASYNHSVKHFHCVWHTRRSPSPPLSWGKSFGGTCGGEVPGGISSSDLSSICSPRSCSPSGRSPEGCSSSPLSSSCSCRFSSTRSQTWRGAATAEKQFNLFKEKWHICRQLVETAYEANQAVMQQLLCITAWL